MLIWPPIDWWWRQEILPLERSCDSWHLRSLAWLGAAVMSSLDRVAENPNMSWAVIDSEWWMVAMLLGADSQFGRHGEDHKGSKFAGGKSRSQIIGGIR